MENISLGVKTKNKDYALALGRGLEEISNMFLITIAEYVENNADYDLVLSEDHNCKGFNVVLLTDVKGEEDISEKKIYKYDHISSIASKIVFLYEKLTGKYAVALKDPKLKIVGFVSGQGGCGCTSIALAFAQEMRRFHGKSSLYISLGEMEATDLYMRRSANVPGIEEYLYRLFSSSGGQGSLESFLITDDYRTGSFVPSTGRNALKQLDKVSFEKFMSSVATTCNRDIIVLDIGNSIDEISLEAMGLCNTICYVTLNKYNTIEKRFLKYIQSSENANVKTTLSKVINKCVYVSEENEGEQEAEDDTGEGQDFSKDGEEMPVIAYIDKDADSFLEDEGITRIFIDSDFGLGIKEMSEMIMMQIKN